MKTWTTLAELKNAGACQPRYRRLCKALGGARAYGKDTPIPLLKVLETNGITDVKWALRTVPSLRPMYNEYRAKYKSIYDDYRGKIKAVYDDYLVKRKPLDNDYLAKAKPITKEYLAKCKALLVPIRSEEAE